MKKKRAFIIAALLSIPVFFSCSGSKEASALKKSINGNWTLKTIQITGNNSIINAKVFNEADNNCFIESSWNFVSNNGTGYYSMPSNGGDCAAITRKIVWTLYEPAGEERKLQFKRMDDKNKPMDDNNGYRLNVISVTDTDMQLKSTITYNGSPVDLVYNFVKK